MYYGLAGYNSKGIIPSLCGRYGINYMGADAYAQLLFNDKTSSKQYASNFGARSPRGYIMQPNVAIPIFIEKYIEGYEVKLITVGPQKQIAFCEEVQLLMENKSYFNHDLWSFETKSFGKLIN